MKVIVTSKRIIEILKYISSFDIAAPIKFLKMVENVVKVPWQR